MALAHAVALVALSGGAAQAQVDLEVELENLEDPETEADLSYLDTPAPPDPPFPRRLRWGRAMTPAGMILLATGVTQLAAFAKNRCHEPTDAPTLARRSGGILAGVGLGLTLAGTFSLVSVPRSVRGIHAIPARRQRSMVGLIASSMLTVAMPVLTMGLIETVVCGSS